MKKSKLILLLYFLLVANLVSGKDIFLSPDQEDIDGVLYTTLNNIKKEALAGASQENITIHLKPGNYTHNNTIVLDSSCPENLTIKVDGDGKAIFNGGKKIDFSKAKQVSGRKKLGRLHINAKGNVYSLKIDDQVLISSLKSPKVKLSMNGQMMALSRYPNVGFAHHKKVLDKGAIYAHGRTLGDPPTYTMDKPIGAEFTVHEKDIKAWEKEMKSVKKAFVIGYLGHDWYKQYHQVAAVKDGKVKLLEYSRYGMLGFHRHSLPRRFYISNLLCELDSPGEFYFDEQANELFFWPLTNDFKNGNLSIWTGKPFIQINGAKNVRIENIIVESVGKGDAVVQINDSENIILAGCIIRNSACPAVIIKGGNCCGLKSCDIYDVPHHITLNGGNTQKLIASNHFAKNCHFTQIQAADYYGKIDIGGVGQIFQNNLVHNFIGQVMVVAGNDHLVEHNEFFNIGIEEGDGGTIYSGSQMWSWGNVYRHNFLHHLMCIPEAHPRGGIYPDDGDQGDVIVENIFYKAAHRSVLMNGGAGHTVCSNMFLNGHIGIYNTGSEQNAQKRFELIKKYDNGELKRGDKDDIIWRTEQVVGKEGWNNEIWQSRYPKFAEIMNQKVRRHMPLGLEIKNNCFNGNFMNTKFITKDAEGKRLELPMEEVDIIDTYNNRDIELDIFTDYDNFDFSYKVSQDENNLPNIEFKQIGLYQDEYRTAVPSKEKYRNAVKNHFKGKKSFNKDAKYNPSTINDEIYFNTGALIMNMY